MQCYYDIESTYGTLPLVFPEIRRRYVGALPLVVAVGLLNSVFVKAITTTKRGFTRAIRVDVKRLSAVLALPFEFRNVLRFLCLFGSLPIRAIRATSGAIVWPIINLGRPSSNGFTALGATGDNLFRALYFTVPIRKVASTGTIPVGRFFAGAISLLELFVTVGAICHISSLSLIVFTSVILLENGEKCKW